MILPLRRRHRFMLTGLAVALPTLYLAALAARPPEPVQEAWPPALGRPEPAGAGAVRELGSWTGLWSPPAGLATRAVELPSGGLGVELAPATGAAAAGGPDPLVYWSPGEVEGEGLPGDAYFLGPLGTAEPALFPLPAAAAGGGGRLLLYSLGHGRVVSRAALPPLPAAPGED